jgi:hypothetical protein
MWDFGWSQTWANLGLIGLAMKQCCHLSSLQCCSVFILTQRRTELQVTHYSQGQRRSLYDKRRIEETDFKYLVWYILTFLKELCLVRHTHTGRRGSSLVERSIHLAQQPNVSQDRLILEVSRWQTTTHHSRYDSSRRGISPSQRPLPDSTHKRHQCSQRDSNPQSQTALGHRY